MHRGTERQRRRGRGRASVEVQCSQLGSKLSADRRKEGSTEGESIEGAQMGGFQCTGRDRLLVLASAAQRSEVTTGLLRLVMSQAPTPNKTGSFVCKNDLNWVLSIYVDFSAIKIFICKKSYNDQVFFIKN